MSSVVESEVDSISLQALATLLDLKFSGDPETEICGVASLANATDRDLSFCMAASHIKELENTQAAIVITTKELAKHFSGAAILTENPEFIFAKCAAFFKYQTRSSTGIHATAVIGKNCNIAADVSIGANCVIGDCVTIGAGTVLHANVTIYNHVTLGERVEIFSGAVIGAEGFGFTNYKGEWMPIPQLGTVQIGNDVSIGANTAIDRGALDNTVIGDGVKIDNLVQIAHNVQIGANTVVAGCVGISGSVNIGKNCMLGGSVKISDHVNLADGVLVSAGTGIAKSIDIPGPYATPGISIHMPASESRRLRVHIKKLGNYVKRLIKLEKELNEKA